MFKLFFINQLRIFHDYFHFPLNPFCNDPSAHPRIFLYCKHTRYAPPKDDSYLPGSVETTRLPVTITGYHPPLVAAQMNPATATPRTVTPPSPRPRPLSPRTRVSAARARQQHHLTPLTVIVLTAPRKTRTPHAGTHAHHARTVEPCPSNNSNPVLVGRARRCILPCVAKHQRLPPSVSRRFPGRRCFRVECETAQV